MTSCVTVRVCQNASLPREGEYCRQRKAVDADAVADTGADAGAVEAVHMTPA